MTRIVMAIVALVLLNACGKDFLNVPTKGVLIRQEYVKDLQTTQEYLNGIYSQLPGTLGSYQILYADIVSDNIEPASGSRTFLSQYNWDQKQDELNSYEYNMNPVSVSSYNLISGCNFVIEKTDQYKVENESTANIIKGQALTIRAMLHFSLVNIYAQPYYYTPQASHAGIAIVKSSDWTVPVTTRSSVFEVYSQIISDLKKAISMLPPIPSSGNTLYINANAAKAFLARVYLYQKKYRESSSLARDVLSIVPIMTTNYPEKLFTLEETEAIFQLPQHEEGIYLFPGYFFRENAELISTTDMARILNEQPDDVRKEWIDSTDLGWVITKYPQGIIPNISTASIAYYQTAIRSSEMCLIASESYANMPGYEDSARYFLDVIRKRANTTIEMTTATGSALIDSIHKEKRKEFAFEGHRMYDLLRSGRGVVRKDASNGQVKELPYPSNKAVSPIPANDILLNGFEQNPGY